MKEGHGVGGKEIFGANMATEKTNIGVVGGNEPVQTNIQLGPWGKMWRLPGWKKLYYVESTHR